MKGFLTEIEGESMYCIQNFDSMDPFFMSIVSSSDLWMYISSSGSLTAGRQNCNNALFPYYTDDKIHESSEITGPKTIIRIFKDDKLIIWEPFSMLYQGIYSITRNLYKNTAGNKIVFEEVNNDLKLSFVYCWMNSDNLGWIRKCKLQNLSGEHVKIDVTDGLQNIISYGITRDTQSAMSTLMDAYKVAEFLPNSNLALYRMSSIPVDRAEPSEALRTNVVWAHGINIDGKLLSSKQLGRIRFGEEIKSENEIHGVRTSFFIHSKQKVNAGDRLVWYMVADVAKDSSEVVDLQHLISDEKDLSELIERSVSDSSNKLHCLVSLADGVQHTGDPLNDRRHFANTMFNIMRGGIFENGYKISTSDFIKHLEQSNQNVYSLNKIRYSKVNHLVTFDDLLEIAIESNDIDLIRLTYEYLPLSFSRRHGDPSRPWNFFDINIKNPDGSPSLNYQGNWRDIFQNWEALSFSFPEFLPGMITRFLNASTIDGYNPYRLTREGFDWEVPEPDNPWAYIGYWGDHQIIYFLKFIELLERFYPGKLAEMFDQQFFVYANVPYRIKAYNDIVKNPQDTIDFDRELHASIMQKAREIGADGKLVTLSNGEICRASFLEKILVSLLAKLTNFVPDAGIWLNTQRPEWNDANNALVGNGASMVTLYQIRKYIHFFVKILSVEPTKTFSISNEVLSLFGTISEAFNEFTINLEKGFTESTRKGLVDKLGNAGSTYRLIAYNGFSGDKTSITGDDLLEFFVLVLGYINQTIINNKRNDGLYHSYNLIKINDEEIMVQNLQLMLEGQAAVLSCGYLSSDETSRLMDALFKSSLWREDQKSFLLYPYKQLPSFMDKNVIPKDLVDKSLLIKQLILKSNSQIVKRDQNGDYHFNSSLRNVQVLRDELKKIPSEIDRKLVESEVDLLCDIYEEVFQHRFFTGRSGSFYKYEGLGSIYWHLVSKLLHGLGESIMAFAMEGATTNDLKDLTEFYHRVKEGIGVHKNPKNYGAFPTDPYSHTPSMMGAQQPGMTGQVKEDFLSRFNELGLLVNDGEILFMPILICQNEFSSESSPEINFTFCNTPIIYKKSEDIKIEIYYKSDSFNPLVIKGNMLGKKESADIFSRANTIEKVVVFG